MILCCGGLSYGVFSKRCWSLLITDRNPPSPVTTTKNVSRCCQVFPARQNHTPAEPLSKKHFWGQLPQRGREVYEEGDQTQGTVAESKEQWQDKYLALTMLVSVLFCFCLKSCPSLGRGAGVKHCSGYTFFCSWLSPSWSLTSLVWYSALVV